MSHSPSTRESKRPDSLFFDLGIDDQVPPKRRAKSQKELRNHTQERESAKNRQQFLFHELAQKRSSHNDSFLQTALAFLLCCLPYKPKNDPYHVRQARLADGTILKVCFVAMARGVPLPYGQDRTVLHWIVNRAISLDTLFVPWTAVGEFFRDMGIPPSGQEYEILRQRWKRIANLGITIGRGPGDIALSGEGRKIFTKHNLPPTINPDNVVSIDSQEKFGIWLDPALFAEIKEHHVPISLGLVATTAAKSQMQDIMLYLCWRSYSARLSGNEVTIPWEDLRGQLGGEDTNDRRIRQNFKEAITELRRAWPELNARVEKKGLRIGKPINGKLMVLEKKKANQ